MALLAVPPLPLTPRSRVLLNLYARPHLHCARYPARGRGIGCGITSYRRPRGAPGSFSTTREVRITSPAGHRTARVLPRM
jgi:hypothetical protein